MQAWADKFEKDCPIAHSELHWEKRKANKQMLILQKGK